MKSLFAGALALCLGFTQFAAAPAFAAEASAQFRTVAPQSFSSEDLQRYGLSADEAAKVQALQEQGHEVLVLTPEQARHYTAGESSDHHHHLWLLGALVIIVVAVAVAVD